MTRKRINIRHINLFIKRINLYQFIVKKYEVEEKMYTIRSGKVLVKVTVYCRVIIKILMKRERNESFCMWHTMEYHWNSIECISL